jgi:hypothetical protein
MEQNSLVEALRRAHVALLEDLRRLEQAVDPSSGGNLLDLRARLAATYSHVTEHFRFEEENGYLDAASKREPRLERTIRQLAEEHRQLTQSLDALVREAQLTTSLDDAFRERVREWLRHVRRHEHRENEFVQDAFNLDIGPED